MVKIKIKRLKNGEGLNLLEKATEGSSGFDIRAAIKDKVLLEPFQRALIPAGFIIEIPKGYEGQIRTRSGLAIEHGIFCLNSPGTIDSDYRGEVKVILANFSKEDFIIERGMRIAQLVITKCEDAVIEESDSLSETSRGKGGFGHSGIK